MLGVKSPVIVSWNGAARNASDSLGARCGAVPAPSADHRQMEAMSADVRFGDQAARLYAVRE